MPNQKGVADGQIKWHCSACMASFLHDGPTEPDACPQGHPRETTDEFSTVWRFHCQHNEGSLRGAFVVVPLAAEVVVSGLADLFRAKARRLRM